MLVQILISPFPISVSIGQLERNIKQPSNQWLNFLKTFFSFKLPVKCQLDENTALHECYPYSWIEAGGAATL